MITNVNKLPQSRTEKGKKAFSIRENKKEIGKYIEIICFACLN